jgi:anti-sigma factor RsiW
MHAAVIDSLEEYLSGSLNAGDRQRVEAHLNQCEMCREEVAAMEDVSLLLGSLHVGEAVEPAAGFYARVLERVEESIPARQAASFSLANLFAFDLAIGRRLAFAALLMLAILGSFLVSRETGYNPSLSPESIMAQQDSPSFGTAPGHDAMLLTLTAYER